MTSRGRTFSTVSVVAATLIASGGWLLGATASAVPASAVPAAAGASASALAVPSAPFITGVSPEGLGILVDWDPSPAAQQVSGYALTATVAPGFAGQTPIKCAAPPVVSVPGTDSSALIASLCAHIAYVVTVTATNAAGPSPPSAKSQPAVPLVAQPPAAPVITSVSPRGDALVVGWSAPATNGGEPVTHYTLTATAGSAITTVTMKGTTSSATVTGLTNGTAYTLALVAASKAGASRAATATGTPSASALPHAPLGLQVVPDGHGHLLAQWSPPADPGAAPVRGYALTTQAETQSAGVWSPTGSPLTKTLGGKATSATISHLDTDSFYAVSVAATSVAGTGAAATITNPITPKVMLAAATVVLTQPTMDALASDTGGTLVWNSPAPAQVTALTAGAILVGPNAPAAPTGLIAKVTSITSTAGVYHVVTTTAGLTDAFADLGFGYSGNPFAQPGSAFHAAVAGVRRLSPKGVTASIGANLAVDVGSGAMKIKGQVDLTAALELSSEVDTRGGLPAGVSFSADATVTASASLAASVGTDGSWQIGEVDSPEPIEIVVGVVPIIVWPKLPVFLTVSGDISVGIEASMTVGAGLAWSSQNPDQLTAKNLTEGPHLDGSGPIPGVSVTATGTVGLQLQPQLGIYDLAGPNVEADAELEAEVDFLGDPWFTLTPSISEKVGLDFDILGGRFHGSLERTLLKIEFPAFTIERSPNPNLAVSPVDPTVVIGTPTAFTATSSDGKMHAITWSIPDGAKGDSVSKTGVLTAVAPAGRTLTVVAKSSAGSVGASTVTVAPPGAPQGFGPVRNLTATQPANTVSGHVTWSPPTSSGGSAIAGYVVTTSSGIPTQTTTSTAVTIPGLRAGSTYVITVFPVNVASQAGPPTATTLHVEPACTDTFTESVSSDWGNPANWSANAVPGPGDWACVHNFATLSVSSSVAGLELDDAYLTLAAGVDLSASSRFVDNDSTIYGPGTLTVDDGATASLDSYLGLLSSAAELDNFGTMTVAPVTYYQSEGIATGSTLENGGTLIVSGGGGFNGLGTVVNDAGAVIECGSGSSNIGPTLVDRGTVDVGSCTLSASIVLDGSPSMTGSGTIAGHLAVAGAVTMPTTAHLDAGIAGGGTLTFPAGSTSTLDTHVDGGTRLINQANLLVGGVCLDGGAVLENDGALTMNDASSISGGPESSCSGDATGTERVVNGSGGSISFAGATTSDFADIDVPLLDRGTITSGKGTLYLASVEPDGSPTVTGSAEIASVTVTSSASLGGRWALTGAVGGGGMLTLPTGTHATIGATDVLLADTTLVNNGTLTVGAHAYNDLQSGSLLDNRGNLVMTDGSDIGLSDSDGSEIVNETTGTIRFDGTSSAAQASVDSPLTDRGTITVAQGELSIISAKLAGAPTVNGPGTTTIYAATVTTRATLAGTFALDGVMGGGTLTIPAGSTADVNADITDNTRVRNQGTITVEEMSVCADCTFENAGTLVLTDSASVTLLSGGVGEVVNDPSGTVAFSGSTKSSSAFVFAPLVDRGIVHVAQGILYLETYEPTPAAILAVTAVNGRASISVGAALQGTLAITTAPGTPPPVGTKVTVLSAASVSGTFTAVTGAQLAGEHWVVSYTPTTVVLTATAG